jgi:lipopolysaccharide assembly outer membrane protein LptD (OstA)
MQAILPYTRALLCACLCAAFFAAYATETSVHVDSADKPVFVDTSRTKTAAAVAPVKAMKPGAAKDTVKKAGGQGVVDTVYYGADGGYIDYDVENKQLKLIGNAVVKYQDITLNADSITYFIDDGLLVASGKPQLVEKRDTTVGEAMVYNIKTKRGRVRYASAHLDDAYFNGNKIVKTENNDLYIDEGNYTTCAFVDTPDYYFYGKTVKVIPNDQVISRPVVFAIGDGPVAWLPYFIFPLERNRKSGFLTPIWGGHPESGGYLDNLGYYFVPNEYMDATAWMKIYEFNNFMFNAASRYSVKYWLNGSISGNYANSGSFLSRSQQWSLTYTHNQNITPDGNTTLSGSGTMAGSNTFFTTYSEDSSQILNQSLNANMSLSQRFPSINASANLTWNRNMNLSTGQIDEDLPSINFNLPSRPLIPFTPRENLPSGAKDEPAWYNNIFYSYSATGRRHEYTAPGDTGQDYQRMALGQSFSLNAPQKVLKYITVTPNFSVRTGTFDSWMDTTAKDTTRILDTLFDTLTKAQFSLKSPAPGVAETLFTFNPQTRLFDTTLKTWTTVDTIKKPNFPVNNQWTSDYSWNTGVSVSTILYGLFPIHLFNFVGLRHTFTPTLSYTFTPKHDLNKRYTFQDLYDAPRPRQSQSVGISIANEFQGKVLDKPATGGDKPVEKKFQILSLTASTSYDFEAPTKKFGDLSVNANTGYEFVRVGYNSSFWMYDGNDRLSLPLLHQYSVQISPSTSLGLHGTLWEGDKIAADSLQPKFDLHYLRAGPQQWQVGISPTYTFSQSRASPADPFVTTKQYSLGTSASINFTRNWFVSWQSSYNFVTNQLVDHVVHFKYDQDCWEMQFDWSPAGYNPHYYFIIKIKKIPEIKWEQRG